MSEFTKLLVANRGEIAVRIMRTARAEGLQTVAVYTDADADAPHVGLADQAVNIGVGPAADSYLSIDTILRAARFSGADAIHPGYGFLSENADFATACQKAGLVYVGPPAKAVALMGNKAAAKLRMIAAGVPCVPGYQGADQSLATLEQAAGEIGYPVMVKAVVGGGGRGMRLVATTADFAVALQAAKAEALAAFGSDEVILEKAMIEPRHVEVQIFADRQGAVVHFGERDCSIQRRHQKVVEEAPSPALNEDLRARMGAAAVEAARAISYEGAGTVEFLLDNNNAFYFIEMNTRLQVEHPVTEMVTGHDLVALQLRVARGEPLGLTQDDITLTGHAIEVRLYAEDPAQDFMPSSGKIDVWCAPSGPGIRVDSGINQGQFISPYYDPMLAKIIAHGATRAQARQRMIAALESCVLFGLVCNRDFLRDVLKRSVFAEGRATTAFIAHEFCEPDLQAPLGFEDIAIAAILLFEHLRDLANSAAATRQTGLLGFGSAGYLQSRLTLGLGGDKHPLTIRTLRDGGQIVRGGTHQVIVQRRGGKLHVNDQRIDLVASHFDGTRIWVATRHRMFVLAQVLATASAKQAGSSGHVTAPMHGNVRAVFVAPDDYVKSGDRLLVIEAMKMQHEVLAQVTGQIETIVASAGLQVKSGDLLMEIKQIDA